MLMLDTAVNRRTRTGRPLGTEYAVDVMTALKAITIDAAYQCFDEKIKGSFGARKIWRYGYLGPGSAHGTQGNPTQYSSVSYH